MVSTGGDGANGVADEADGVVDGVDLVVDVADVWTDVTRVGVGGGGGGGGLGVDFAVGLDLDLDLDLDLFFAPSINGSCTVSEGNALIPSICNGVDGLVFTKMGSMAGACFHVFDAKKEGSWGDGAVVSKSPDIIVSFDAI